MKTLIASLLVFAVVHLGFAQGLPPAEPAPPPNPKAVTWIVGGIFLACVAVGTYVIIKVSSNIPSDTKPTTFVLESSNDNYTWTPIATNTVVLNGQRPVDCFKDHMRDGSVFYRTRIWRP